MLLLCWLLFQFLVLKKCNTIQAFLVSSIFGGDVCVTLLLFWSFFQFQCCFVCDALASFGGLLWCDCLRDTHVVSVIASIMLLLFVQYSCGCGCCFNFGVVVSMMLMLFWSLLLFWCCSLCSAPFFFFSILVLLIVPCYSCFGHCFDFGVCIFCDVLAVLVIQFWCCFLCNALAVFFWLFQIWCGCLWYLIPDLVIVSISVLFFLAGS